MSEEFCPNCDCFHCREKRQKAEDKEIRERKFSEWSWNLSAAEVAEELSYLHGEAGWCDMEEVMDHFAKFFSEAYAYAVQDVFDTCYT